MKKLGYTKTSRDNWGPLFMFWDVDNNYIIRLAWNPILLLEYYYKLKWWTNFMSTYNDVKETNGKNSDKENLKILIKAKIFCEEFIQVTWLLETWNKSMFVIYKE